MDATDLTRAQIDRLMQMGRPFVAAVNGHRASTFHDSDWGGPHWDWVECTCGWIGTTYTDAPHDGQRPGGILDVIRDLHRHVGTDTAANVTTAAAAARTVAHQVGHQLIELSNRPELNPEVALAELEETNASLSSTARDLFDAVLIHTIVTDRSPEK